MFNLLENKEEFEVPADLVLSGKIQPKDAEAIFGQDRLRVGIFAGTEKCEECDECIRWLEIQFLANQEWRKVLALDERNFPTMMSVFNDVDKYLTKAH